MVKESFDRVECRFRRTMDENWTKGKLIVGLFNKDGSLNIIDGHTGASRAIEPEYVQIRETGPRGGKKWVPYAV